MVGHRLMEEVYMWTVQWSNKVTLSHEDRHISNGSCVEYISLSGIYAISIDTNNKQTNKLVKKTNRLLLQKCHWTKQRDANNNIINGELKL